MRFFQASAHQKINAPLLTDEEVSTLILTAPLKRVATMSDRSTHGHAGEQLSATKGSGTDFDDVRPYQPGDDPRRIDWRATARLSLPFVRTFHTELGRPVYLLVDRRSNMRFGTRRRLKVTQAVRGALWLAGREARAGQEIAGILLDSPSQWLPQEQGMVGVKRLASLSISPCPPIEPGHGEPGWATLLASLCERLPAGCELFMLSDFMGLKSAHVKLLRMLGQHCKTSAVRIFDPIEVQVPLISGLQFRWGARRLQAISKRSGNAESIERQQQKYLDFLATEFPRAGINYQQLRSDQDELTGIL